MSETVKDYMPNTPDINQERLELLKQKCPDWFTAEGQLDIEAIKKTVDPKGAHQTERFEFTWFGKDEAKREAFTPTNLTLKFDQDRSVNPDKANGNLIIEGENLEVLKMLLSSYRNMVKCIYIDPPYNKGDDRVYHDNYTEGSEAYWEKTQQTEEGVKIDTNTESSGRFHSDWLNMMYPRLLLARQLLKDDGVIFVSIGDREVHHLKSMLNNIFGEENFEGHIHWRRRYNQPNDRTKMIGLVAEHVLAYAKDSDALKKSGVGKVDITGNFSNPDNDPKGAWASKPWKVGSNQSGSRYTIETPTGKKYTEDWMGEEMTFKKLLNDNRIVFPDNGNGAPRKKYYKSERKEEGQCATNWWHHKQFGHNQGASSTLEEIFGSKNIFDNPKPIELIRGLVMISGAGENDIVLDFFAGSGSTGHSIMDLNREEQVCRKFIQIQLPEKIDEDEEAYEYGFRKVSDIMIERNKRVIQGYGDESQPIDSGFKVYALAKSNFPRVEFSPDPSKSEEENVETLKKYIAEKESSMETMFNKQAIIDEVLLKNGFMLDYTLSEQPEFEENDVFLATDDHRKALVCLDKELSETTVEQFKGNDELKFICLERALDTSKKFNLKNYLGDKLNAM